MGHGPELGEPEDAGFYDDFCSAYVGLNTYGSFTYIYVEFYEDDAVCCASAASLTCTPLPLR